MKGPGATLREYRWWAAFTPAAALLAAGGAYLHTAKQARDRLAGEIFRGIMAEEEALKRETKALPAAENAAPLYEKAAALLPKVNSLGGIQGAVLLLDSALRRQDLACGDARLAVSIPGWDAIEPGREPHRRLHALHADMTMLALLDGTLRGPWAEETRRTMGLSSSAFGELDSMRTLRADPGRDGGGTRPDSRPATRLEDLVPGILPAVPRDPLGQGALRYEVRGDGWTLSREATEAPTSVQTGGKWLPGPIDLTFSWPPAQR